MVRPDPIQDYLQRLTPLARSNLLTELERLESCGTEIPGSAELLARLRAEFRKDGSTQTRLSNPSRYFFAPLEPLLIDGAPEHANSGRMLRGSLSPIWEWINRDLLPTMARDYVGGISPASVRHLACRRRSTSRRRTGLFSSTSSSPFKTACRGHSGNASNKEPRTHFGKASAVQIDIIETLPSLARLEDNWNAVYDADPEAQIFLSWKWLSGWLACSEGAWFILAARASDSADAPYVAFFPLRLINTIEKSDVLSEVGMTA